MQRILLVDDNTIARSWLREFLEDMGYACKEAENGAIALDLLQAGHFNLVITDNQMPVMSGLELLENLQTNSSFKSIPTILLTGELTESVRSRAVRAGVKEIFNKPWNVQKLSLAVMRLVHDEVTNSNEQI